jgi:hypothetical protein
LKGDADKIALPPDHATFAHGVKFVERQFEIQRQQIEAVELDPGTRHVKTPRFASKNSSASFVIVVLATDRRSNSILIPAFTPARAPNRLSDCPLVATSFVLFRKQSILTDTENRALWEPDRHQGMALRYGVAAPAQPPRFRQRNS